MHSVSGVKLSKSSPKTSKYLQRFNNSEFCSKSLFSRIWAVFEAGCGMHSVSRVKLSKSSHKTSKYLKRLIDNSEFPSKSRFSRLWSGFDARCAMHSKIRCYSSTVGDILTFLRATFAQLYTRNAEHTASSLENGP
jgi:hypothetical protein